MIGLQQLAEERKRKPIDPRIMDYLQSRSRDDERIDELMGERRLEKEAAAKQQAQQDFLGSLSRGAAQMGAIGGQVGRSTFQPGQVDADTRALDIQIAQEAKKPSIDARVSDYLMSKKEQTVDPIREGRLKLDREKFEFEKQKRAGSGRGVSSGRGSVSGSPQIKPKKMTEGERKSYLQTQGFARPALQRLSNLVRKDGREGDESRFTLSQLGYDEAVKMLPQGIFARFRNPELQEWQNEASSAVEGLLKAMSGAASTNFETDEYRQMFTPLPGETLDQQNAKLQRLERAVRAIEESIGIDPAQAEQMVRGIASGSATPTISAQNIVEPQQQTTEPQPGSTIKVGDTVGGYRFKGGNSDDPNNWEKVQ